jgi:hypothetical protein
MKVDSVKPSVAPGPQQNVAGSSAAKASLQNVKPGYWASPAGSSTLTHRTTKSAKESARTLIRDAIAESKRDGGALHEKLANAFGKADADVREAMRVDRLYKKIVREWAKDLVHDAWNAPRTTIHQGDQVMRELDRAGAGLPRELAADLVVWATPVFLNCSRIDKHNKGNGAIFSSNDKVAMSMPSSGNEASEPNPDEKASKPGPEASLPNPDVEAANPSPGDEPSRPNPDVEASKPSPDPEASMPKYADYTYFGDLKAWIAGAEVPNPKQDDAIRQLERLVDKS